MRISKLSSTRRHTTPPAVYSRTALGFRFDLGLADRFGRRVFFWFIKFTVSVNSSEHAVDKFAGVFAAKGFGELNGFINGHFGWHVALDHQLVDADAQHDFIDLGDLVDRPFRGGRPDDGINSGLAVGDTSHEIFNKVGVVDTGAKLIEITLQYRREITFGLIARPKIMLIERLHSDD